MPLSWNLRKIKHEPGRTVFGYVCKYSGMSQADFYDQVRRVRAVSCDYMVFDKTSCMGRRVMRGMGRREVAERSGLKLLMRGLLPGDIVVVDSLGVLSVEAPGMYDALGMLRSNEIRVLDIDPDGLLEWRAPLQRALASMCRVGLIATNTCGAHKKRKMGRRVEWRGVGWISTWGFGNRFKEHEGSRIASRTIERLRDEGMSFEDIAERMKSNGVPYQGCMYNQSCEFTAALAEECYVAAKQEFPHPAQVTLE